MTEIPDEDRTGREGREAPRQSPTGDRARETEPDLEERADAKRARERGAED